LSNNKLENITSRILKANLSWNRKKSNSSNAKDIRLCLPRISFFFAPKARHQAFKFECCQIILG